MKRKKHKTPQKKKPTAATQTEAAPQVSAHKQATDRRNFLETLVYGAIGVGVVGGGGWYFVSTVQAGIAEADLSRLGNGIPTVVQIHDPQCPRCRALQKEARKALSQLDEGSIQYLVANIRQEEGQQMAAEHGVGHVTLLLFDGNGQRTRILAGESTSEILLSEFRHLIRMSGSS